MSEEGKPQHHPPPQDAGWALSAAGREVAEAWLREQTRLARLQADDIVREDAIRHWSLRFSHASTVMKLAFELALALIFLIVALVVADAVWSARNAGGLVIEAFQVPPDLAGSGLSGQVVASRLLDKVSRLQDQTDSLRAPDSYANNWGDDIKVQIPDTGVSIGEAGRYLRQMLGHETRITGEIWREGDEIAVVARAGGDEGIVFRGKESELDALLQKAAEAVFERTQPYRAAVYFGRQGERAKAGAILRGLVAGAPRSEKAWAQSLLANDDYNNGEFRRARDKNSQAIAFDPNNALAPENRAEAERELGWDEAALADFRRAFSLIRSRRSDVNPAKREVAVRFAEAQVDLRLGDFANALRLTREIESLPDYAGSAANSQAIEMLLCGWLHDRGAVARLAAASGPADPVSLYFRLYHQVSAQILAGDTTRGIASFLHLMSLPAPPDARGFVEKSRNTMPRAASALALARLGDFEAAKRSVDRTPVDCDFCMIARGEVAALAKDWGRAEFWFRAAAKHAPSLPFAETRWGAMLLAKGDADGAIAKLRAASRKGPRFADPLEVWGEALMAKNRSDLALGKFADAARYAPSWKRLHWKWSEALLYAGRKDEAAKQLQVARGL